MSRDANASELTETRQLGLEIVNATKKLERFPHPRHFRTRVQRGWHASEASGRRAQDSGADAFTPLLRARSSRPLEISSSPSPDPVLSPETGRRGTPKSTIGKGLTAARASTRSTRSALSGSGRPWDAATRRRGREVALRCDRDWCPSARRRATCATARVPWRLVNSPPTPGRTIRKDRRAKTLRSTTRARRRKETSLSPRKRRRDATLPL